MTLTHCDSWFNLANCFESSIAYATIPKVSVIELTGVGVDEIATHQRIECVNFFFVIVNLGTAWMSQKKTREFEDNKENR